MKIVKKKKYPNHHDEKNKSSEKTQQHGVSVLTIQLRPSNDGQMFLLRRLIVIKAKVCYCGH